jgi:microcin C transport system permease protein
MALFDPATREKFKRFRKQRRAWVSLLLLGLVFVISLCSELIAHPMPFALRFEGKLLFPRFARYPLPQDLFLGDGVKTPPDYRKLETHEHFTTNPDNRMWWPPIRLGPSTTMAPEDIDLGDEVTITRRRRQHVAALRVTSDLALTPENDASWFFGTATPEVPSALREALTARFNNRAMPAVETPDASGRFDWSLSPYEARSRAPRSLRILLRERLPAAYREETHILSGGENLRFPEWWEGLPDDLRTQLLALKEQSRVVPVDPLPHTDAGGVLWDIGFRKETVQFPFRPVKNHPLGLDQSGRDVRVNLLYATRISLLFGFTLVVTSMFLGTIIGGLQGYIGGGLDLICQRLIEIYEAIPFLYVMILIGSIFGKSFGLLLFIYAIFNWIGISYYMRAEFLKLRSQPFTEAARALGLPAGRIMWKHILPNALVPLITFFPFSLVGAIGSLSALDYLGFGLPAGTPSWGDLLQQAQTYRYAWWLILYPSLTLFVIILLGVFVGEGLRSAFDPKREAHWEA